MSCAGRDLHPHALTGTGFWDLRVCIPPPAHKSDRIGTGVETLARSRASRCTTVTGAFGAIRTRGLLLTEETLYPLELRRHELGAQGSNLEKTQGQSLPGLPIPPPPIKSPRPESNRLPARYKLAALPSELQGRSVPGAIRTRTTDLLGIVTPAVGRRGRGASAPPRTGCLRLTGSALWPGELQRLELGNLGSNQEPLGPGPSALPDCAIPH